MPILIGGGILLGVIFGLFFKWPVLIPACALTILLVLANPAQMNGFLGWFIQPVVLTLSLQIGYFLGWVALIALKHKRSKAPVGRSVAKASESGKRAA